MDWTLIINYLLTDKFVFAFALMLLNVFAVIMATGFLKAILKQIPKLKDSNWRRVIQTGFNIVIGGVIGYCLYGFAIDVNILLGSTMGFFSAVIYKIGIKKIYDKFGVNCEPTINKVNSDISEL